ncbi:unnamed protein product, partial [Ectocarpus sp. 8 AP-2014]
SETVARGFTERWKAQLGGRERLARTQGLCGAGVLRWSPRRDPGRPFLTGCSRVWLFYWYKLLITTNYFGLVRVHLHTIHVRRV